MKREHVEVFGDGGSFLIHPETADRYQIIPRIKLEGERLVEIVRDSVARDRRDREAQR